MPNKVDIVLKQFIEEIVMFEEGKTRSRYFNMTNIAIIIIIIIALWVFIAYKRTFYKR